MMAEAVGKATGRPGICFVTRGPGATNASPGIHIAQQDSTPLIMFAGQVARDVKEREALQELDFRAAFQKVNGAPSTDAFSAYSFDGWLVFIDAATRAVAKAEPGTPEFRVALRDAIATTKEVVGTHGVYNFKVGNLYGVDNRARVIVKLDNGQWKLAQ